MLTKGPFALLAQRNHPRVVESPDPRQQFSARGQFYRRCHAAPLGRVTVQQILRDFAVNYRGQGISQKVAVEQAGEALGIVDIHLASVGADVVGALRRHNRSRVCRALPSHGIRRNTRAKGRVGPHDRPGSLGPLDEGL